jgi:hypothetical protein
MLESHPFERCYGRRVQLRANPGYRLQLAQRYAYVLPESHLLDVILRYSPLIELGAGTGYWSWLLRQRGADIVAYDKAPPGGVRSNRYHYDLWPWTDVREGDIDVLQHYPTRSLFLCWPPLYSSLGDALRFFRGGHLVYIGDEGGRTLAPAGLSEAFDEIERHGVIAMDPAPGAPAHLSIWRRKSPR